MKRTLTVNSKTNGTLKTKKVTNNFRNAFFGLLLSGIAFLGMSFTTEDTTQIGDTIIKTNVQAPDSCCTVNVSKDQVVITANFGTKTKHVLPNLNIEKMVNDLFSNKFKQINIAEIKVTDKRMDINFKLAERRNTEMAVAFRNKLMFEVKEADTQLTEQFTKTVIAPAFGKSLSSEILVSDNQIDAMLNDEAELKAKIAAYSSRLISDLSNADENMDQLLNVSAIKNIQPIISNDADKLMDAQIINSVYSATNKTAVIVADLIMDELINKN